MLQAASNETTAPCPRCEAEMTLAVVIPHPIAPLLARHTYLCAGCNQTKTYILPVDPTLEADGAGNNTGAEAAASLVSNLDRRADIREAQTTPATIYDKAGAFLWPCTVRDISRSGARLALFKDAALPQYFLLSLLPDGGGRRLCSKVWQLALVAGVRFVEKAK